MPRPITHPAAPVTSDDLAALAYRHAGNQTAVGHRAHLIARNCIWRRSQPHPSSSADNGTTIAPSAARRIAAAPRSRSIGAASSARIWRSEMGPCCRKRPFYEDLTFPAGVEGPLENSHGRCNRAAWRSFSMPADVRSPRSFRFRRPAACRRGFLVCPLGFDMLLYLPLRCDAFFSFET
jgi:hypothetical protein